MILNVGGWLKEKFILESKELESEFLFSNEGDVVKVLEVSRNDCNKVVEYWGDGVLDKEE